MAYRSTPHTEGLRLQARARVVRAAQELVARGGYREASVAAVARRAGVATGSVYRHFPSKAELFAEVFRAASQREVDAVASAAAAPDGAGPRIAAAVRTFSERALRGRRLAWALLAEPVDPAIEAERLVFRGAYRDVFAAIVRDAIAAGELPEQDPDLSASALVGAIGEALVGPTSPTGARGRTSEEMLIARLELFCLRSVGVPIEATAHAA